MHDQDGVFQTHRTQFWGVHAIPETIVDALSDLQQYKILSDDRQTVYTAKFFTARRAKAFINIGFRTGFLEIIFWPILIPLSLATIDGYIPIFGQYNLNWFNLVISLTIPFWISLLFNMLLLNEIRSAGGFLWALAFKRLLEGRSMALFICGGSIFAGMIWLSSQETPSLIYTLGDRFPQILNMWDIFRTEFYQTGIITLLGMLIILIIPWIFFLPKWIALNKYEDERISLSKEDPLA